MNSDLVIVTAQSFIKSVNKLAKKYPSLPSDLITLRETLLTTPYAGDSLGKNCYKVRMKISSKGTGKSGGARVITLVKIELKRITLLDIYDKSEKETITDKELEELIKNAEE